LVVITDANHGRCKVTRRSVDAIAVFLWGNLVAYGAKKQGHVSLSPYEAELGGVTRGCVETKHIAYILLGMRVMVELPIPAYVHGSRR